MQRSADPDDPGTTEGTVPGALGADELFAQVYASLRALAHQMRGGRASETLGTTALVHEAYLRLSRGGRPKWKDEAHFFAVAARAMRQILVDAARRHLAQKRGGGVGVVSFDDALHSPPPAERAEQLVALDEALERLERMDPRRAQVVEHRVFAGLSTSETARVLGISTATVERDWRTARAWLAAEIADAANVADVIRRGVG